MKIFLATIALLLAQGSQPSAPAPAAAWRAVTSNDGSWIVRWRLIVEGKPAEVPLVRKRFTIELQVESKLDPTMRARALTVDAQMPEHLHGMNVAPTVALDDGGQGGAALGTAQGMLFHMSGRWEVDIDIDDGTTVERAQWNIALP
ncbi:MAG: hypothetical protein EXS17_02310 [Phycisphaerales bacterium]|nr:hypothetical protein [Phycisphaerales bacterium]